MTRNYMTPFEHHQHEMKNKVEHANEKEDAYKSTGYVKLPWSTEVLNRSDKQKRAPQPSPLLKEWMEKKGK